MKLNRRGLLKLLPSAPFAVREAQKQAAALAQIGMGTDENISLAGGRPPAIPEVGQSTTLRGRAMVKLLRSFGILPDWKIREIRREARWSRRLDPDIASLQSMSLSARINMQWRRNEERILGAIYRYPVDDEDRNEFLKKYNLDWF